MAFSSRRLITPSQLALYSRSIANVEQLSRLIQAPSACSSYSHKPLTVAPPGVGQ